MLKYLPSNTLSYFNAVPQRQLINVGAIPVPSLAINCRDMVYAQGSPLPRPERAAVEFYLLNHLASWISERYTVHEPLPPLEQGILDSYTECLAAQGKRMVYYLCLITTREARHLGSPGLIQKHVTATWGKEVMEQIKKAAGKGPDETANLFMNSPPQTTLSNYFGALPYVFSVGKFGHSYGGEPWAEVAKCLASFLDGKTSMEMLLDTAFALAHNTAPIFNKGMLYAPQAAYGKVMLKILDVQRSGQMPHYVLENGPDDAITGHWYALVKAVKEAYPTAFGATVDWGKVATLGALGDYTKEKAAMKVKAVAAPTVIKVGKQTFKPTGAVYQVLPNVQVPIMKRETALT